MFFCVYTNLSSQWWMSVWNCVSSRTLRVKLKRTLMASFRGWREQGCVWLPGQSDNKNIQTRKNRCHNVRYVLAISVVCERHVFRSPL